MTYSDAFVDVEIWIALAGQPLPCRLELGYKQVRGTPKARIDFKSWDLAPRIADGTFTLQPGEATKQIAFEQFVAGLLSRGDPTSLAAPGPSAPGTSEVR